MTLVERNGGALVVEALLVHGVDTVFGIPGTHNLEIYRGLSGSGIRHVTPRHEQGAGYAADAYARVSGKPGVAIVTTGPALLNIAAAVGQAYSDSVPLLVISPGMPVAHPAHGTGLLHETKNQSAALDAIAAYSHRVTSHAEIPVAIAQAFASFASGRPRPVHIEVPFDLLTSSPDEVVRIIGPIATVRAAPDPKLIEAALLALRHARRPALVIGGGCRRAGGRVAALAEILGAPVLTTTNGKGLMPEDHTLAVTSALHLPAVSDFLDERDVVLAIGTELAPTDFWFRTPQWIGQLIRVDIDPAQLVINATPDIAIVSDAALALDALIAGLSQVTGYPDVRSEVETIHAEADDEGARWMPWLDAIASVTPRNTIIAADNAMGCYYGALANLAAFRPAGFLFPTGFGTLGFAVPAGIGAAIADPRAAVVALSGDGGLMFSIQELATAAAERICLPVVVFDNGGYGEIRAEMRDAEIEAIAVDLPSPDFVAMAVALGGRGVVVQSPDHLATALSEALRFPGPTVIVVPEPAPATDVVTEPAPATDKDA